jgi:hypothetical protein
MRTLRKVVIGLGAARSQLDELHVLQLKRALVGNEDLELLPQLHLLSTARFGGGHGARS